jgi:hypothetical protein
MDEARLGLAAADRVGCANTIPLQIGSFERGTSLCTPRAAVCARRLPTLAMRSWGGLPLEQRAPRSSEIMGLRAARGTPLPRTRVPISCVTSI